MAKKASSPVAVVAPVKGAKITPLTDAQRGAALRAKRIEDAKLLAPLDITPRNRNVVNIDRTPPPILTKAQAKTEATEAAALQAEMKAERLAKAPSARFVRQAAAAGVAPQGALSRAVVRGGKAKVTEILAKDAKGAKGKKAALVPIKVRGGKETVSSVARQMIADGDDNATVWKALVKKFALPDSKKSYPAWYRSDMKRKGQIA